MEYYISKTRKKIRKQFGGVLFSLPFVPFFLLCLLKTFNNQHGELFVHRTTELIVKYLLQFKEVLFFWKNCPYFSFSQFVSLNNLWSLILLLMFLRFLTGISTLKILYDKLKHFKRMDEKQKTIEAAKKIH